MNNDIFVKIVTITIKRKDIKMGGCGFMGYKRK